MTFLLLFGWLHIVARRNLRRLRPILAGGSANRSPDHQRRNARSRQGQDLAQAIVAHRRCLRRPSACFSSPAWSSSATRSCPSSPMDTHSGRHSNWSCSPTWPRWVFRRAEEDQPARTPIARQGIHPRAAAPAGRAGLGGWLARGWRSSSHWSVFGVSFPTIRKGCATRPRRARQRHRQLLEEQSRLIRATRQPTRAVPKSTGPKASTTSPLPT